MAEKKKQRKIRKHRQGVVLKDKMDKGIVVWIERTLRHPKYQKVIKIGKKYYVHDENNEAKVGDRVAIVESRPISKLKRWRLVEIVKKAHVHASGPIESAEE